MKLIDLKPGDSFTGYYLMRNIIPKRTKTNKPYLSMALTDVSASVESMVWDYGGPNRVRRTRERVAWVQGVMKEYRGTLQITVEVLRPAEQQEYFPIIDTLVPTAPLDRSAAYARVEALVATLEDDDFRRVAETVPPTPWGGILPLSRGQDRAPRLCRRPADAHRRYAGAGRLPGREVPDGHQPGPAAHRHTAPRHCQAAGVCPLGSGRRDGVFHRRTSYWGTWSWGPRRLPRSAKSWAYRRRNPCCCSTCCCPTTGSRSSARR